MLTSSIRILLFLAVCLAPVARVGHAQSAPPTRTPGGVATSDAERVARDAFAALEAGRYRDVAALAHPAFIWSFRAQKLDAARAAERYRREPPTGVRDTSMPAAVAEWFEAQRRKHEAEQPSRLAYEFAGVASLADLEALDGVEMLARWLEARDPRTHYRRALERAGRVPTPDSADGVFRRRRVVLGAVRETDSTVAVVYHTVPLGGEVDGRETRAALVTLRRAGAGWRLWAAWHDPALFDEFPGLGWSVSVLSEEETARRYRDAAAKVIAWPTAPGQGASGRAYVVGHPGGERPPRGLVVEARDARGRPVRVEVPAAAFGELAELLSMWPTSRERR